MKEKGNVLVLTIAISMFLSTSILIFSYYLDTQTKWAEKSKRQSVAYNAAYAGIQQAINKLNNLYQGWENAAKGIIPQGYDGTTIYNHIGENGKLIGYYKVKITSVSASRIIIASVGSDTSQSELRGLKVTYVGSAFETSIKLEGGGKKIKLKGADLEIHWGSVQSCDSNIEAPKAAPYFPRKWAGEGYRIINRDPNAAGEAPDEGPTYDAMGNLITDKELFEWRSNVKELQPTTFDLGEYKTKAMNYRLPTEYMNRIFRDPKIKIRRPISDTEITDDIAISSPCAPNFRSGYFPKKVWAEVKDGNKYVWRWIDQLEITFGESASKPYIDRCSTATYYIEGDEVKFQNNSVLIAPTDGLAESEVAIIVLGNVRVEPGRNIGSYSLELPETAWKEYTRIDTTATGEYPGDIGYRKNATTYDLASGGYNDKVVFNGFLYVGGDLKIAGNSVVIGCLYVKGDTVKLSGNMTLFYNIKVAQSIIYEQASWTPDTQKAWSEFSPRSFTNPVWQ